MTISERRVPRRLDRDAVAYAASKPALRSVVAACIPQPRSVKDIADLTGIPLASAYRHVNTLEDKGLLFVERSAVSPEGKPYDLYRACVRSLNIRVTEEGVFVEWEPNEAIEDRLERLWSDMGL